MPKGKKKKEIIICDCKECNESEAHEDQLHCKLYMKDKPNKYSQVTTRENCGYYRKRK